MKLKYNDTGKEKECLPQVGQWNMMNKVLVQLNSVAVVNCLIFSCSVAPIRIKLHSDKCSDTQGSGVCICEWFDLRFGQSEVLLGLIVTHIFQVKLFLPARMSSYLTPSVFAIKCRK